ncbi:MAG: hypothetical protein NC821_02435 [Candidatus Omnitrophica bacterium]|nr:hypothetical protein [Candidatus Omnitrophota bacterium]
MLKEFLPGCADYGEIAGKQGEIYYFGFEEGRELPCCVAELTRIKEVSKEKVIILLGIKKEDENFRITKVSVLYLEGFAEKFIKPFEDNKEKFLLQFRNKDIHSSFKLGKGIDSITGATPQATVISFGIAKEATLLEEVFLNKRLIEEAKANKKSFNE